MKLGKCVHDELQLDDIAFFGDLPIFPDIFRYLMQHGMIFIPPWRIIKDVFDY